MERVNVQSGSPFEDSNRLQPRRPGGRPGGGVGNRPDLARWNAWTLTPRLRPGAVWRSCSSALEEAGGRAEDVVRTRTYLLDATDANAVGEAHGEVFSGIRPASTMVVVSGLLDPRWKVEMELEAVLA